MEKKLLVICGPTATGKTILALKLAKKFDGELVSADSRQVYRGMDIGTGKDITSDFSYQLSDISYQRKKIGYYLINKIKIWGYDLVDPKKPFSVGEYLKIANKIIEHIYSRNKLPILVGGTGLYIKAAVDGLDTIGVRADQELRAGLAKKDINELQEILRGQDPVKLASMNNSDINNPLRLVRAIEIAQSRKQKKQKKREYNSLFVGLKLNTEEHQKIIQERVKKRTNQGQPKEVKRLIDSGISWGMQSMSSLGYGVWRDYFEKKKTLEDTKNEWVGEEKQYVKKQLTWFKKDKRINWFDPKSPEFEKQVEALIKKWHN